jgi:hypothetical protein
MTPAELKNELRIWALECFVCEIFSLWCVQQPSPGATFVGLRDRMIFAARNRTFQGVDPAMSDHLSAELEAAVERLTETQKEQLKAHLKPGQYAEFLAALEKRGNA